MLRSSQIYARRLIPAGTGLETYRNVDVKSTVERPKYEPYTPIERDRDEDDDDDEEPIDPSEAEDIDAFLDHEGGDSGEDQDDFDAQAEDEEFNFPGDD